MGGAVLPAIIVAVNPATEATQAEDGSEIPAKPDSVNLQIFTDESLPNLLHCAEVEQGGGPGQYSFPQINPPANAKGEPAKDSKKPADLEGAK